MSTSTTFPNGQTLVSSALTLAQLNAIFQPLLTSSLGILPTDPLAQSAVRVAWQTEGAPAWVIGEDVLSFELVEEDSYYAKNRDVSRTNLGTDQITTTYEYTRVWRVKLVFRGPNSTDHARLIRSALLLDWTHDTLALNNLYVIPSIATPLRVPELYSGQWWEVVVFNFYLHEQVTETIGINAVASVEVILNNSAGEIADIIVME